MKTHLHLASLLMILTTASPHRSIICLTQFLLKGPLLLHLPSSHKTCLFLGTRGYLQYASFLQLTIR
jgi:hypothetical protein